MIILPFTASILVHLAVDFKDDYSLQITRILVVVSVHSRQCGYMPIVAYMLIMTALNAIDIHCFCWQCMPN